MCNQAHDYVLNRLLGCYPPTERTSWGAKVLRQGTACKHIDDLAMTHAKDGTEFR